VSLHLYDVELHCNFFPVIVLTLFETRGLEIVVSHVMVPLPYRFSLGFLHSYGNLTILKFSFKWVKVMLPYTGGGGGLPVVGGGQPDDS
jgi:hypothetical protein